MSMALVLAGLLPPAGTVMQWNPTLNWQPVPIYSQPLDEDSVSQHTHKNACIQAHPKHIQTNSPRPTHQLLLVRTPCPRYYEALDEVFRTPELRAVLDANATLFAELSRHTGMPVRTPDDVQSLYSTLRAESELGLELPAWTRDYFPDRLLPLTELSYMYNVHTAELQKLKAGPFVRRMLAEWQQRRAGRLQPAARRMFLYTGHDSTIVNVLVALDVWQQQLPVYGMMAIFELLETVETGEWSVRILLRSTLTDDEAVVLRVPGCAADGSDDDDACPLARLEELVERKLRVRDARRECEARNKDFTTPAPSGP